MSVIGRSAPFMAGSGDPAWLDVAFLITGESSIADVSSNARAITLNGGVPWSISSTQKKFGSNSIRMPSPSDADMAADAKFNMSHSYWTNEGWGWWDSFASGPYTDNAQVSNTANDARVSFYIDTTGHLAIYVQAQAAVGGVSVVASNAAAVNGWYHYAFVKNGTNYKIFLDGVMGYDGTIGQAPANSSTYRWRMGSAMPAGAASYWTGYQENTRFTISNTNAAAARYSANFTPPTGNYPVF